MFRFKGFLIAVDQMSKSSTSIIHPGIIEEVRDDQVRVKILSMSACASCHAKGACTMADMEEKIVTVFGLPSREWVQGQAVDVEMKKDLGPKAVLLGYIYPFLAVLAGLIGFRQILPSEGAAALAALSLLLPYYTFIYLMRNSLQKTFVFEIKPRPMYHPSGQT